MAIGDILQWLDNKDVPFQRGRKVCHHQRSALVAGFAVYISTHAISYSTICFRVPFQLAIMHEVNFLAKVYTLLFPRN